MHNLLLGTAKHITSIWKEQEILRSDDLREIQDKVDQIKIPPNIGRICLRFYQTSVQTNGKVGYLCILYTHCMEYFQMSSVHVGVSLWMPAALCCNLQFL